MKCSGNIRQRSQGNDRNRFGRRPDLVADDFFRGVRRAELGDGQPAVAQAVDAVQMAAVDRQTLLGGRCRADARQSGRIELLNNRLHVPRRQMRRNIAPHGRHRDHFQIRVEQCNAHGKRVIDARIHVEDDFLEHSWTHEGEGLLNRRNVFINAILGRSPLPSNRAP